MRRLVAAAGLLTSCATPLSNRIDVGNEAFVVVAGEGAGGIVDLFAVAATGGTFQQLTFTRDIEDLPRLSPDGTRLAFLRGGLRDDNGEPVVMELLNGNESAGSLPADAGRPTGFGWNAAGDTLVARTDAGVWWSPATSGLAWSAVPADRIQDVDDWLAEHVGAPGFGRLARCGDGSGWCIVTAAGETALGPDAVEPIRWGDDAVAYRIGDRIEIRPLGGGRIRQPAWVNPPGHLHHVTHHPGAR